MVAEMSMTDGMHNNFDTTTSGVAPRVGGFTTIFVTPHPRGVPHYDFPGRSS
jgi:hypothetical protein